MTEKLSVNEIIELLHSSDTILKECIESFARRNKRAPNREEILGAILAKIQIEKYSKEEQQQLEQRIELYLYNMFDYDDEEEGEPEFNYPPDTPPFVPNMKGVKRR